MHIVLYPAGVDIALAALCDPSFLEMNLEEGCQELTKIIQHFPEELAPSTEPHTLSVQSLGVLSGHNSTSSAPEYIPMVRLAYTKYPKLVPSRSLEHPLRGS